MNKKPVTIVLALVVMLAAGFVVYTQMNKNKQVVDMFDNPSESMYAKVMEWSVKYNKLEDAKAKQKLTAMVPSETFGKELKQVYVRRGSSAAAKSYILMYDDLRIDAAMGPVSPTLANDSVKNAVSQFSNETTEVKVHGTFALAAAESQTSLNGVLYKIPATVAWWEGGFTYLAVAKNMSVDDLLKVCNSTSLK
ncbi:MAG: hypothetical protein HY779_00785 [Rubrobacteridae bacterium]|nr:hypothetical protein [Rubrobacteridae bacterium]